MVGGGRSLFVRCRLGGSGVFGREGRRAGQQGAHSDGQGDGEKRESLGLQGVVR